MATITETERINLILSDPTKRTMTDEEIIETEIKEFMESEQYKIMLEAERYYRNRSDVQNKKNDVANRSNTKIEHPLLKKMVDQKGDYLLAKPFTLKAENKRYAEALNKIFGKEFRKKLKSQGKGAVKLGIAWIQPYFSEKKGLRFMRLPSTEVIPAWEDEEKESLGGYIRFYSVVVWEGTKKKHQARAEVWTRRGVRRFVGKSSEKSEPEMTGFAVDTNYGTQANGYTAPHFQIGDTFFNFDEVPVAWTRYNEEELPLFYYIKELINDINWQTSVTADTLRDIAKFIYVLKGYGGQDLAEFVKDLQKNLAIKVDPDGGVDKLQADLNIEAVVQFLEKNHQDAVYYGNGVDTKDPELGNASGDAIHFRYMDLDNDCQGLAAELQDTFERLKPFIDVWLQATRVGDFTNDEFEVVFNMDMPVNESDVIANIGASQNVLSQKTLLENHPWVTDAEAEMAQIAKEKEENMKRFGEGLFDDDFGANNPNGAPPPVAGNKRVPVGGEAV